MSDRYGNVRITKIKTAFDELRAACRAEGTPRIQQAIDRYEPWADFAFARPSDSKRGRAVAKKRKARKGGKFGGLGYVSIPAVPWDHGATGQANRVHLVTEPRGEIDPNTGKTINPNNVHGVRRLTVPGLLHRRGKLTTRQFLAADALRAAWEQKDRSPPAIQQVRVDCSPKPDDRTAMVVDRAMAYARIAKHVPAKYAAYVNHVARDNRHLKSLPGYRTGCAYMERLQKGLDMLADKLGL